MTTTLRTHWTATSSRPLPRIYVQTPRGHGYLIDAIALEVQVARNALGVVLDGCMTGAKYFRVDEVQCEKPEDGVRLNTLVTHQEAQQRGE